MRLSTRSVVVSAILVGQVANAFVPGRAVSGPPASRISVAAAATSTDFGEDCGCGIFLGDPPERVRTGLDVREAIRTKNFYTISGDETNMDELIGEPNASSARPSIVVLVRFLGCPMCHEQVLRWSKQRDELERQGIQLVVMSLGTPEKGRDLVAHLGIDNGEDLLFVDPENAVYDALDLNRGVRRTFFSVDTPYALLDRMTSEGGMNYLVEVLKKYAKGASATWNFHSNDISCICFWES